MKQLNVIFMLALLITSAAAYAQTDKELAYAKGKEAVTLMDKGQIEESIKLLEEAQKLDPENFDYPYEIALAHYLKQDYKGAIRLLEKDVNHKNVTERLFQLLGNSYDMLGDTSNAFKSYDAGLAKFPDSGMMYLEKGNVYWGQKQYGKALPFYEKGIQVDPGFSSNYYRATRIYCGSTEKVWGLIYGELFMNLERNSKRTAEISKLLYDTYTEGITITGKSSATVQLCKQMTITVDDLSDAQNIRLPYCMTYEPTLLLSLLDVKKIDPNSLSIIRTNFVKNYFVMGHNIKYPNVLFDYQNQILEAGHLDAYNHWLLMKGDEDAFEKWMPKNKEKWEAFVTWFTKNKLLIDETHKFSRSQY